MCTGIQITDSTAGPDQVASSEVHKQCTPPLEGNGELTTGYKPNLKKGVLSFLNIWSLSQKDQDILKHARL